MVKIDRTFITDLGHDPVSGAIVEAVHRPAGVLGLRVVVEGVETEQQHERVVRIGCELAQGFLYGYPVSSSSLLELLAVQDRQHPLRRLRSAPEAASSAL